MIAFGQAPLEGWTRQRVAIVLVLQMRRGIPGVSALMGAQMLVE